MTGTYEHALDTKSRLSMPSRLREELGDSFHLAMGADECLTIYPQRAWEDLCRRADELEDEEDREAMEVFFAQTYRCTVDAQNRIVIPTLLREYAQRAHGIERLNILRLADDDIRRLAGGEHGIEPHRKALAPVDILPFQFYIRKRLFDSFVNQIRHTGIAGGFSGEHRQQHLFLLPRRFRRRHNGAS